MSTYLMVLAKMRRPSATPSASTSRSRSSRMMSAASLATSVAESTEMPTSAWCSASASLTPSPRNATAEPASRWARRMRAFCSGLTLAKIVARSTAAVICVSSRRVEVGAGERAARAEPQGAADRLGDERVVAGDDLHGDAELGESRDRAGGGWLGLIEEHEIAGEGQVVLVVDADAWSARERRGWRWPRHACRRRTRRRALGALRRGRRRSSPGSLRGLPW